MKTDRLVLGLLDNSAAIGDPQLAAKYRDLTISFSRFGYHGVILERSTVDAILHEALSLGFRYCLIQPYGHVILERWKPDRAQDRDYFTALDRSLENADFLVVGQVAGGGSAWFGFEPGCLLVNLERYQQLGCPRFDPSASASQELPDAVATFESGRISSLRRGTKTVMQTPERPGWRWIQSSLQAGLPVRDFAAEVRYHSLYLPTDPPAREVMMGLLGAGIERGSSLGCPTQLSAEQVEFLQAIHKQTSSARRGVFLWNIESYDDIQTPPSGFRQPISTLYTVAAGFKPNRLLHTHGFNQHTRVIFFDYSPNALAVRMYMVECWEGEDFPDFVRGLFEKFPHPRTFYQLWNGCTPADVDWRDVLRIWQGELSRWGGSNRFREHWRAYRDLPHSYICCDLLQDPQPVLGKMESEPGSVIWWSNAFFTICGNWLYSLQQRQEAYEYWIRQLAERNPQLYMYGSDYTNANVNFFQAAEYYQACLSEQADYLKPRRAYKTQIRM